VDVFTYTITDGDGDTSTTTLTIDVNDVNIPGDNDIVQVNEAALDLVADDRTGTLNDDLAAGTVNGSNPASADETVSGQLVIAGVGASGYTVQDQTTAHGVFHLNADGSYTYTLTTPFTGSGGDDGTAADGQEVFNYTAHDGDGNEITGTVTVNVLDDVPTAAADTNSVDEGGTLNVPASGVLANDVSGADGFDSGGGVTGVATGSTTTDPVVGNVGTEVDGSFGKLTLYADGHYDYVANADTPGGVDHFVYTITDGDGDTSTTTLDITVNNVDRTPTGGTVNAFVDDEGLANGIAASGTGDIDANAGEVGAGTSSEAVWTGTLQGSGGDAPISFLFAADLEGDPVTVGTESATYHVSDGGLTLTAVGDRGTIFTVHIDNAATGDYTLTLNDNVLHTAGDNTEASVSVDIPYTVKDADTSTAPGTIHATFNDDMPTASATLAATATVSVDESGPGAAATIGLGGHSAGVDEDVSGSALISRAVSGSAVITPTILYGADGAAANQPVFGISVTNADSGLETTEGEGITLLQLNSTTILGIVAAGGEHANEVAFAIAIGSDGKLTVEQYLSLDHPVNPDPNDVLQLDPSTIAATVSATDADGDTVTSAPVDISGQISFYDDGPTLGAFTDANMANEVGHVDGTYVFDWGADGLGGLTVTGPAIEGITYPPPETASDGTVTLHGMSGTTEVFNLVVHPDGTYTFNLVTPDAGSSETHTLLNIASGQNEFIQTPDGVIEFTPLDHDGNDTGTVNSSGAGFGNGNQFTGNGEAVTFEFHSTNQAGDQAPGTNPDFVSQVTLDVPSNGFNGSTELITWYATNTSTGETATGTILVDTTTQQLVFDPGFDFNVLTIEGSDADGNGIRMTQITTTTRILPQGLDLGFTIQATDGDGDPTGTSTLTVQVNPNESLQSDAVVHTEALTISADTSTLTASNDNSGHQQHTQEVQRISANGQNAAVMGALAAVGIEADHMHIDWSAAAHGSHHAPELTPLHTAAVAQTSFEASASVASSQVTQPVLQSQGAEAAPQGGSHFHDLVQQLQSASHGDARQLPGTTELLQGSDAPAHGPAAHANAVMAAAVAMPSAAQLAAAHADGGKHASADGVQHDAVVGKVLADSLHGGEGHGPNIDALLAAHAGHSGAPDVIEALASHGAGGVPYGHSGGSSAIAMAHSMFSMAMMHHDAAPPAHG